MKKITLYLHILMLLLISSCSNEDILPTPQEGVDGKICEVSFWASIPETTGASRGVLGEATATSVESLSLLVFDAESGLYLYKSDATLTDQTLENGIHKGKYTAELQLTDKPRIIHFVANVGDVPFQANELAVLSQLKKDNNQDAYWQKAVATSITGTFDSTTQKYIDGTAPGITGTGTTIKLVRNFARVTLNAATNSDFNLAGFVLVNTATKGTVAPYLNQANENGSYFPNYDTDNENGSAMSKYAALIEAGYSGVQPSDATIDKTVPAATTSLYTTSAKYLYERTQEKDPVYIIAKRQIGSGSNISYRYYKIDIMKKGGTGEVDDYYKILRNFSYDITINSVEGNGYETPEDAAKGTAANNLTASLELKDLTNIAYGNERLFVNKTEIVWTSEDPITFKYLYQLNGNGSNSTVNSLIIGEANSSGAVCSTYSINSSQTDAEGYSTISITHTGLPASGYKQQEVTIKAGTLMRSINLILRRPYESNLGCDDQSGLNSVPTENPEIPETVGSSVYVYFSMPAGVPESIFPLSFILAPEAHSITPNGVNMPVVSLLNHANTTMKGLKYGFEKVVTWDEYKDYASTGMIVQCPFKTSLVESATNIYLYNEYFNFPLSTYFINPREFKNLNLVGANRYGSGQEVTINFNMNSLDPVTITVTEGSTTSTINYTPTAIGNQSVTYTTKTWNSQISVKLEANGYDSVSASGGTRNKLMIKIAGINNISSDTDVSAYRTNNYSSSYLIATKTASEWTNGYIEIEYSNINSQNDLNNYTIYFRSGSSNSNRRYANATLKQLFDGNITLNMNKN